MNQKFLDAGNWAKVRLLTEKNATVVMCRAFASAASAVSSAEMIPCLVERQSERAGSSYKNLFRRKRRKATRLETM
jgi:hypothetical protein